jgi:hypothetical protein
MRTDQEVIEIVQDSRLLRPLLKKNAFEEHFMAMDSDNSGEVTWEEFLAFCRSKALEMEAQACDVPAKGHTYSKHSVSIDERRVQQNNREKYRRDQTAIL